ncbi:MAG: tRNA (N6-threonylcarbamoyladenosine(37)-N6)-methyltransferase TrmO [Clostridia bacterium]|nr:tRNA (N6-threonylcarbamoyladenosine(37)-N6)-methyltransferase TrmO [Clostridia bacterium]
MEPFKPIATIVTDFPEKFGVPRQSGLIGSLSGKIIFEPSYRSPDALKGLEDFSHIWLLWLFSENKPKEWSPTVRPPRLGGNRRMGVFATRSPYRPNPIGLSAVKLEKIEWHTPQGPVLTVSGVDMVSGTPILDIKPYLPYADVYPDATGGFTDQQAFPALRVALSKEAEKVLPKETAGSLQALLAEDPRPHYHHDEERVYGLAFAGYAIRFQVREDTVTVLSAEPT